MASDRFLRIGQFSLLLAIAIGAGPFPTSQALANDWPSLGLDLERSRRSAELSGTSFDAGGWRYQVLPPKDDVKIDIASSPAVADGFVVFATLEGTVRALSASDGKEIWKFSAHDGIVASPAIAHGRVFVGSFDRTLYALNLADGALLWSRTGVGISHASAVPLLDEAGEGVLLVTGFPERRLIRFDAASGKTIWQTNEGDLVRSSHAAVAVGGGRAVLGTVGGRYQSFDTQTGKSLWTYDAPGTVHLAAPIIDHDRVYFAPGDDNAGLHAVTLSTGLQVEGWPVFVVGPTASTIGKLLVRKHAVSSPILAAGQVLLQVRFADFIDTNKDGTADRWDLCEVLAAFDITNGKLKYQVELARESSNTPNVIPGLGMLPTPAAYLDSTGKVELVAVASSMSPTLKVIRAKTGDVEWAHPLSSATRGSPVFANGRMFLGLDKGALFAMNSGTNQAPLVPDVFPDEPQVITSQFPTLKWGKAMDPDGDVPSYVVRIDEDGEVLRNWLWEFRSAGGITELSIPDNLKEGKFYVFSIRARDKSGAMSGWSPVATFKLAQAQTVSVGSKPFASIGQAVAKALNGDTVKIGAGRFVLDAPLNVAAGVNIEGAGPGKTVLDGGNLTAGLIVQGTADAVAKISRLTIAGADVGISVAAGKVLELDHVVVRDAHTLGLKVATAAEARVSFSTFVRNGTGVASMGQTQLRNSIVVQNDVGLAVIGSGQLVSAYNNVFDNHVDVDGTITTSNDVASSVKFVDTAHDDFHVKDGQPTTDKADPASDFANEAMPNGARANLGAYGNTAEAELTIETITPDASPPVTPPVPTTAVPPIAGQPIKNRQSSGCSFGAHNTTNGGLIMSLLALALLFKKRRRGEG